MPEPPWLQRQYPGKTHLLRYAAAEGQLLIVKCNPSSRADGKVAPAARR